MQRAAKKEKASEFDEDRSNDPSVGVGSVAAGGRYDELVGMFSGKSQIPCVGISFGVDRIFSITKARMEADKNAASVRSNEIDVFVMAFGKGFLTERMEVCKILWDAGIKVCLLFLHYLAYFAFSQYFKIREANHGNHRPSSRTNLSRNYQHNSNLPNKVAFPLPLF